MQACTYSKFVYKTLNFKKKEQITQASYCSVLYIPIILIIENLTFIYRRTDVCFSIYL